MKRTIVLISISGLMIINGCSNQSRPSPRMSHSATQSAYTMDRDLTLQLEYLLYLPEGYGNSQDKWPLLVFLHGLGERGPNINKVKAHGPPKLIEQGWQFPFIVVSPQCPETSWWPYETAKILALVDDITERYTVDEKRIYLTGLSMGGFGTWAIAGAYPDRFAAVAPICGGGYPLVAVNMKNLPVWAFHGDKDPVVPVEKSKEMVDAVNRVGGNAKLTVYPGIGHDAWTQTYNNDEFYEWLLSHSRKQD